MIISNQLNDFSSKTKIRVNIGRWLTTDPAGQYASPYLGMGNNPVNRIDPDGGADCPPGVECLDEVVLTASSGGNADNPPIQDYDWFKNLDLNNILQNGAFFDNPVNAFNLMAIESLYQRKGEEFSSYVLQDGNGDEFAYVNPHYKDGEKVNSSTSSYNSNLIKKEDGNYMIVNGTPYKVLYQIHSHPISPGDDWPSPADINLNDNYMPTIFFNVYNVRRAKTRNWQRNKGGTLVNPNTILGSQLDLVNGKIKF